MTFVDVDGGRIHYEAAGSPDAPALLFLHAGVATSRMWDPQWDDLARDHRVVRYDLRRFGRTRSDDVDFSDRADAIAVLDAAGIARATLVGASRGGGIALDTAVEYPERVAGVVAVGSAASGMPPAGNTADEERIDAEIDAFLAAGDSANALRREVDLWWVGPRRTRGDVDPAFLASAEELVHLPHEGEASRPLPPASPAWDRLPGLGIPMLFAVGDEDLSSETANARAFAEALPAADHHVFAGAAHIPNVEQPDAFLRVLRAWLARHGL